MILRDHLPVMISMYRGGCPLEQIATKYGRSRERVRQLLHEAGIVYKDSGRHLKCKQRKAAKFAAENAKYIERYGHDKITHRKIVRAYPAATHAFTKQKVNARNRGIEWRLKFSEWMQVWIDSGHWSERGRGSYVMGRFGDSGPYALGNVHIITASQNIHEAIDNHAQRGVGWGAKHPNHPHYRGEQAQ